MTNTRWSCYVSLNNRSQRGDVVQCAQLTAMVTCEVVALRGSLTAGAVRSMTCELSHRGMFGALYSCHVTLYRNYQYPDTAGGCLGIPTMGEFCGLTDSTRDLQVVWEFRALLVLCQEPVYVSARSRDHVHQSSHELLQTLLR